MSDALDIRQNLRSPPAEVSLLDELAKRIKDEHQKVTGALKDVLSHAMLAGDYLIKAKDKVKHGEWLPWLKNNCDIADRTARLYMQLANGRAQIEKLKSASDADLTLREAARLLTVEPEDKPKPADGAGAGNAGNSGADGTPNADTGSSGTGSPEAPKNTSRIAAVRAEINTQIKEAKKEATKDVKDVEAFLAKWKDLNEPQRLLFVEDEEQTIGGLLARIKKKREEETPKA